MLMFNTETKQIVNIKTDTDTETDIQLFIWVNPYPNHLRLLQLQHANNAVTELTCSSVTLKHH